MSEARSPRSGSVLGSVTRLLIAQFFRALEQRINPDWSRGWKEAGWRGYARSAATEAAVKPVAFDYYRPETVGEASRCWPSWAKRLRCSPAA